MGQASASACIKRERGEPEQELAEGEAAKLKAVAVVQVKELADGEVKQLKAVAVVQVKADQDEGVGGSCGSEPDADLIRDEVVSQLLTQITTTWQAVAGGTFALPWFRAEPVEEDEESEADGQETERPSIIAVLVPPGQPFNAAAAGTAFAVMYTASTVAFGVVGAAVGAGAAVAAGPAGMAAGVVSGFMLGVAMPGNTALGAVAAAVAGVTMADRQPALMDGSTTDDRVGVLSAVELPALMDIATADNEARVIVADELLALEDKATIDGEAGMTMAD